MKFVQFLNQTIKKELLAFDDKVVIYGQNVDAASCLSGLTRGISAIEGVVPSNSQNSENMLVGNGFGMMLNGVSSIFFMKQLDFLLLGIDQITNTYNIIRQHEPAASFTIFPVTVDSGYEGPQAILNNIESFCSIADIEAYSFTNNIDSALILEKYLLKPGFRILSSGQRLLQSDLLELELAYKDLNLNFFQYSSGEDACILCLNHSLPYGLELQKKLLIAGKTASIFSINTHSDFNSEFILNEIKKTNKVVLIDDSRGCNSSLKNLSLKIHQSIPNSKVIDLVRSKSERFLKPYEDLMEIDYNIVIKSLISNNIK
jgi:pyruvate/2-oxoglutarate/acetoin dehydrogenase E1 component